MSYSCSLGEIATQTGGRVLQGDPQFCVQGVSNDSRNLTPGALFVALVAERDGHTFIDSACEAGAGALLVSDAGRAYPADIPVVLVEDTFRAMGDIAAAYRLACAPKVVGVTGSNGKTSTKEMIARILEEMGKTLYTDGNFNNLIGLPLTIFRMEPDHAYAVLEMGMNAPGEIARLTEIATPDVGVITCVAEAHLEGLGSIEGVARAKGELFDNMRPESTAIINADDPNIMKQSADVNCRRLFFSSTTPPAYVPEGGLRVSLTSLESLGPDGFSFQVHLPETYPFSVTLPLIGRHQVGNALAAIAAAFSVGATPKAIQKGLAKVQPTGRRGRLITTQAGVSLLDDCYNSNPSSCAAGLHTLQELAGEHPSIAVLGDMLELGDGEAEAHARIGRLAAEIGIQHLFAFGPLSKHLARGALEAPNSPKVVFHTQDVDALWNALQASLSPHAWILVKGSRGMRLERISQHIEAWNP